LSSLARESKSHTVPEFGSRERGECEVQVLAFVAEREAMWGKVYKSSVRAGFYTWEDPKDYSKDTRKPIKTPENHKSRPKSPGIYYFSIYEVGFKA
jgi:hypothetical protein